MIKCLESVAAVGMVGDTVFGSAHKILEDVQCGFVVLMMRAIAVRSEESESWSNIRTGAASKPVDRTNNALVYFGSTSQIWVVWIS